jgi:heavy metal translocating P-type ATPase
MRQISSRGSKWRSRLARAFLWSGMLVLFVDSGISALSGTAPTHFGMACAVGALILAEYRIEMAGWTRTSAPLKALEALLPDRVRVLRDQGASTLSRAALKIGDRVCALAGHRFVSDGRILEGTAWVDEQLITGNPVPVKKPVGALVSAGTLNLDGPVVVELTAAASDGFVERLIASVNEARSEESPADRRAARLSAVLFLAVPIAALITLTWHTQLSGLDRGLLATASVLLVACPVLMALATELAEQTALTRSAAEHILLRGANTLESLANVNEVCLAKSGALTAGDPRLIDYIACGADRECEILGIAAALARSSTYVYARAIAALAQHIAVTPASEARTVPGRGVMGRIDGLPGWAYLGSLRFVEEAGLSMNDNIRGAYRRSVEEGLPSVLAGWDRQVQALFVFAENLRPDVHALLQGLRSGGRKCTVFTGDHWHSPDAMTSDLGVSELTDLNAEEKLRHISSPHNQPVAMVGDAINDSPVLAAADVGIALGCGADVSCHVADVCVLGDDPVRLPWLFEFSQATQRTIQLNLLFTSAYNVIGLVMAMGARINPLVACLMMVTANASVIGNSLRLTQFDIAQKAPVQPRTQSEGAIASQAELPNQIPAHSSLVENKYVAS